MLAPGVNLAVTRETAELEGGLEKACPDLAAHHRHRASRQLSEYVALIRQWCATVNLVAAGDLDHLVSRHILPMLSMRAIARSICHDRIADLGSGAGLPGIPLSVSLPQSKVYLIESRRRRASFLRHVVRCLRLERVCVVQRRAEAWLPETLIDLVVSRAVAAPDALLELSSRLIAPHGFLLVTTPSDTPTERTRVASLGSQSLTGSPAHYRLFRSRG